MKGTLWNIILGTLIILQACIESFQPEIRNEESNILVVDGMITNEKKQYEIKLTYLNKYEDIVIFRAKPIPAENALVRVIGSDGSNRIFLEEEAGTYKSDTSQEAAKPGITYQLLIELADGSQFESEPEILPFAPEIDSLYSVYEEKYVKDINGIDHWHKGMQVYVDSRMQEQQEFFLKYEYEEVFQVKNWGWDWLQYYNYSKSVMGWMPVSWPYAFDLPEYCYQYYKPRRYFNIVSGKNFVSSDIIKHPVNFVIDDDNDSRLVYNYSILVRQYSITGSAYEYLKEVEKQTLYTGSFYDPIPSRIESNVHDPTDENTIVAGFFFLSSVSEKRHFISPEDVPGLQVYHSPCIHYEVYADVRNDWLKLFELNNECCFDCRKCGDRSGIKPDFW